MYDVNHRYTFYLSCIYLYFYTSILRMLVKKFSILFLSVVIFFSGCKKDDCNCDCDLSTYNPTAYTVDRPQGFPEMVIPADNPMTVEGIALGRKLFYEKRLSDDNTMSCATCHAQQTFAFTDRGTRFSTGIDGITGTRNAMAIVNLGWAPRFFWDGRAFSLEEQALMPVTNPIEMHQRWSDAVSKLEADSVYPQLFLKAFGVCEIDSLVVAKAIAQFERTLISGNSLFERYVNNNENVLPDPTSVLSGFSLFNRDKTITLSGGDCFHCHGASGGLFTDNAFHNNGLDSVFTDVGLEAVTGSPNDRGKFKSPTLRNIELTAPYMHDGRFATLEEVIEHYNSGGHASATLDPLMKNVGVGLELSQQDKTDLINFLKSLTDMDYVNNPAFSDPH